jgi:hypothetical protein
MRMRRIILSAVACLAPPHFSTWSYKQHNFRGGGGLLNTNMCLISSASVEKSLHLGRIQRDIIINMHTSPCNVLVILVGFQCNLNFQSKYSKNPQISNLKKIRPVGANLCHANGQTGGRTDRETEMAEVIAAFRNYAKAPKNWQNWVITKPVSQHSLQLSLPNRFILIVMHKMHD